MPYRIECLGCKEYVYLEEIKKENTSYPCDACNAPNWLSGTYSKFQEIDDTNSSVIKLYLTTYPDERRVTYQKLFTSSITM